MGSQVGDEASGRHGGRRRRELIRFILVVLVDQLVLGSEEC